MFRSETMVLSEVIFTQEAMWETMNVLADSEKVMFVEKEASHLRGVISLKSFAKNMIRRCEELQGYLEEISESLGIFHLKEQLLVGDPREHILQIDIFRKRQALSGQHFFEKYEGELKKRHKMLSKHIENRRTLIRKSVSDMEKLDAMNRCSEVIPKEILEREDTNMEQKLKTFYGLVPTEQLNLIQKVLFRLSRGNLVLHTCNLDNSEYVAKEFWTNDIIPKSLIFILSPSGEKNKLHLKVERLLQFSGFQPLELPITSIAEEMRLELDQDVYDNKEILDKTNDEIRDILGQILETEGLREMSFINLCRLLVSRELNFAQKLIFIEKRDMLYSLMFWIPEKYSNSIRDQLENLELGDIELARPKMISYDLGQAHTLKTKKIPTYFELNSFTAPFQEIVDTYGVPRYKEVNPALFTIITFPFFFGLMFGDVGHGGILFLIGIIMVFTVKDKTSLMYKLKWLIFLNGFFAVYCGFIYSEWFANAFAVFPSCYDVTDSHYRKKSPDCVYPFGIDYVWYISENEISFLNSFKMKFSIIIGVIQMLLGSILKGANGTYFGRWENVIFESIPQFLFMFCLFGYMSIAIIIKWLTNWDGRDSISIIQMFINFTSVENPLYGDGSLQGTLQTVCLYTCLVSFVVMLIPKPIVLYCRQKKELKKMKEKNKKISSSDYDDDDNSNEDFYSNTFAF